jgi:predicted ATPase
MLKEVLIYNFRCIRELKLELKPLTILVGPNASGKSSILYAIMWFAKKYLTHPSLENLVPSQDEKQVVDIDKTYEDLVFKQDLIGNWLGVTLTFRMGEDVKERLKGDFERIKWAVLGIEKPLLSTGEVSYGFKINSPQKGQLGNYEILLKLDGFHLSFKRLFDSARVSYQWSLQGSLKAEGYQPYSLNLGYGFALRSLLEEYYIRKGGKLTEDQENTLRDIDLMIEEALKSFLRSRLERFFLIRSERGRIEFSSDPTIAKNTGSRGENTLSVLGYIFTYHDKKVKEEMSHTFLKWCEKFGIQGINAGLDENSRLRGSFEDLGITLNLASGSFGHRQFLIFLAQLIASPPGSVIMIEEPEMSLHPEAQVMLPYLFAELIRKQDKQIIITTHSTLIPLAISDVVCESSSKESKLEVNNIALYEVRRGEDGTIKCNPIALTPEGYPKGGIPSFAKVEADLYSKILQRLS